MGRRACGCRTWQMRAAAAAALSPLLLAACQSTPHGGPARPPEAMAPERQAPAADPATGTPAPTGADTIMLIRHAEKPQKHREPYGVTVGGERDAESLTVTGWQRAGALAELFDPTQGQIRAGLRVPDRIYASHTDKTAKGDDGSVSRRPVETVTPLAGKLGRKVDQSFGLGQEAALAKAVTAQHGTTLIAWHHGHIPALVHALGAVRPAVPAKWPDGRFDEVWVFTRDGGTWRFSQVPQLVLAGDTAAPIS
ncbi:hypothetical protein [Streptomyces sp. NPDC001594]|uniref:hypothetical protein n=1 Tax=Streptomyces sp. NPDC001594 TaxID=3364590 RepID=UPI00367F4B0C